MHVKGNHPLAEILAKKLFGISDVPRAEQRKMVRRAIKAGVSFYENELHSQKDKHGKSNNNGEIPN